MSETPGNSYDTSVAALDRAHELARTYVAGLRDRMVSRAVTPQEMREALDEPLPEHGSDPELAVEEWFRRAEPGIVASSGPRFFGYVIGGTTPAALAGDWLAAALDQNAGLWAASPAAAQTELTVLRWLKELFHLPAEWHGAITSGATMSNLVGIAAGRQWAGKRMGFNPALDGLGGHPPIPVVSSTEIHASAVKSLSTLGLGRGSVRTVRTVGGAIDPDALRDELKTIDGPAIVVANAAEVNTGAFDPLDEVAAICREHPGGVWLHVDAAFGLFAAASPRLAHLVRGIEHADSVCSDAHKWLNVPYDSGFVFVRDLDSLREAFASSAAYIAPAPGAGWSPETHLPEMSKRFRGLPAWCALRAYGREGYRELVERCVDNAGSFAGWVDATPELELMAPAPLNIVCFRYAPDEMGPDETDDFNRRAVSAIQADGRVFVTPTAWDGRAAIRAAFDNWATSPADVEILQESLADTLRNLKKT
jgi:glutamate/tyrosine decarboxylase-like PLP-dependent enzyme